MKRIVDYFLGCVRLRLRGCEPERCLQDLLNAGAFGDVVTESDYHISPSADRG